MPVRIYLILLAILVCALGAFEIAASEAKPDRVDVPAPGGSYRLYGGSRALLIGSIDYDDVGWDRLGAVKGAITKLDTFFSSRGFETITVLNPTGEELRNKLRQFALTGKPDGRDVIYFGGHGWTDPKNYNKGYIVPRDAPNPHNDIAAFELAALSTDDMLGIARTARSRHTLFLADSCFSAALFANRSSSPPRKKNPDYAYWEEIEARTFQFITAGNEEQRVPSASCFVDLVLQGIEQAAADHDKAGFVTADELGVWLKRRLRPSGRLSPQTGFIGLPPLSMEKRGSGSFVFLTPDQPAEAPEEDVVDVVTPDPKSCIELRDTRLLIEPVYLASIAPSLLFAQLENDGDQVRSNSEEPSLLVNPILGAYDPLTRFEDLEVRYYRKSGDRREVMDALDTLLVPYQARPAQLTDFRTNALACHPEVDVSVLKAVALQLIENGAKIRLIKQFRQPQLKSNRIDVYTRAAVEGRPPLTSVQISKLEGCPAWLQN